MGSQMDPLRNSIQLKSHEILECTVGGERLRADPQYIQELQQPGTKRLYSGWVTYRS